MRIGIIGLQTQGLSIRLDGAATIAESITDDAKSIMGLDEVGLQFQRRL